jgi:DNA-binding CsgD family transcriptional regulator
MKNGKQRNHKSSVPPSYASTSRTIQTSEENAQNYEQSLMHLLYAGQFLCGQTEGAVERLYQEIAQVTQQHAWLSLHCPSTGKQASQQCPFERSTSYPVQFHDLNYGILYIMNDPIHSTQPVVPSATAYLLAQISGNILYLLEESACLQFQYRQLSQQMPDPLTKREQEVLNLFCRGQNKETIAELLSISSKTVDTHLQHLCEKLHVHHEHDLALAAFRAGLFSPLEGVSNPRSHL